MTTTHTPTSLGVSLLQRFKELNGKGDRETLRREVLAPDVIWRIPGRHPMSGAMHGVDEVLAYMKAVTATNVKSEVLFMAGDDSHVIDVHHAWGDTNGTSMDMLFVLYCEIRDGRIAEVTAFADDQAQCDGFFWATFPLAVIPNRLVNP